MILWADGLSKEYIRNGNRFYAVRDVHLAVEEGDYIGIIGESGSGKSSLLRLLCGLSRPTGGQVKWNAKSLKTEVADGLPAIEPGKIGYVSQGMELLEAFTVLENVCMPFFLQKQKPDYKKAVDMLERVGLGKVMHAFPAELSGGECRRAAIIRALIMRPALLIADEPTGSLDEKNAGKVVELLRQIQEEGVAVIMSTHDTRMLSDANRIFHIKDGGLMEERMEKSYGNQKY